MPTDLLIVPSERVGPVTADSGLASLTRRLGAEVVTEGQIELGEGQTELGAFVFPDDPLTTLAITWQEREAAALPRRIVVCPDRGRVEYGCRWETLEGIRLSTRLSELEELNGRPFVLTGFNWDYGGTVVSWEGGALEQALEPEGWRLIVRLSPRRDELGAWVPAVDSGERGQVLGDRDIPSDHPVMRKLDPWVYALELLFPRVKSPDG